MHYVYMLESLSEPDRIYVGITTDLRRRWREHNSGKVIHTSKHLPWRVKTYLAFSDRDQAYKFERYLKSASGRAFAKKRF
jgi:putative endonuclease